MVVCTNGAFKMEAEEVPRSSRQKKESATNSAVTFVSNRVFIFIMKSHIA